MTEPTASSLNERFGSGGLRFDDETGLVRARVSNAACKGALYLHGAHVTNYGPVTAGGEGDGDASELLFLSREALFQEGKAIRGGVPICFPWFGAKAGEPDAPAHGTARIRPWRLEGVEAGEEETRLTLVHDCAPFEARYVVCFGSALRTELSVTNTSAAPAEFEAALHSYLRVSEATRVTVSGLQGVGFLDQLRGQDMDGEDELIRFERETDRIYQDTEGPIVLEDAGLGRSVVIERRGSRSVVVWNPWKAKAARMADFGDDEWRHMCCIETAAVGRNRVRLGPGQDHRIAATHQCQSS